MTPSLSTPSPAAPHLCREGDRWGSPRAAEALAGLNRQALGRLVARGLLPPPCKLNQRCTRWNLSAIARLLAGGGHTA
jgi:hypothetical protein